MLSAYVPSNLNWSLFPPLDLDVAGPLTVKRRKLGKGDRRALLVARAQQDLHGWWTCAGLALP